MTVDTWIRIAALWGPLVGAWLLHRRVARDGTHRHGGALFLAVAWNVAALVVVNALALRMGWWRFAGDDLLWLGTPVDLLLGWAVLWGAFPVLLGPRVSLTAWLLVLFWIDLALMPRMGGLVVLGPGWLGGEFLALVVAFVPGALLGLWTRERTHLTARVILQMGLFALWTFVLLPETILMHTGGSWAALPERALEWGGLPLQILAIPAALGWAAVHEFRARGGGTPLPFDPPERLVTTGPYAYVANPMQLATALMALGLGWLVASPWVAAIGIVAWVYGVGFARWCEGEDLRARHGAGWERYRAQVRDWVPRWRPYHPGAGEPARPPAGSGTPRLYVARDCDQCAALRSWVERRHPVHLELVPAEAHPTRTLERITYEAGDGVPPEQGVRAVARALEHLHAGWALAGFLLRAPLVCAFVQRLVDVSGGGPMRVERSCPMKDTEPGVHTPTGRALPSR